MKTETHHFCRSDGVISVLEINVFHAGEPVPSVIDHWELFYPQALFKPQGCSYGLSWPWPTGLHRTITPPVFSPVQVLCRPRRSLLRDCGRA